MMHGREKSGPAVVAVKRANKAERPAAESVEPRAGAEGNTSQQSTRRAQYREKRVTRVGKYTEGKYSLAVKYPRWEPYAGKPLVRICAGGAQ